VSFQCYNRAHSWTETTVFRRMSNCFVIRLSNQTLLKPMRIPQIRTLYSFPNLCSSVCLMVHLARANDRVTKLSTCKLKEDCGRSVLYYNSTPIAQEIIGSERLSTRMQAASCKQGEARGVCQRSNCGIRQKYCGWRIKRVFVTLKITPGEEARPS
jgi:hypothetical protein